MSRFLSLRLSLYAIIAFGFLVGACDQTPTDVEDVKLQGFMEVSASSFTVSPEKNIQLEAAFQGFNEFPTVTSSENISTEVLKEEGEPSEGVITYEVALTGSLGSVLSEESIIIEGQDGDQQVTDTVAVAATPLTLSTEFTTDFVSLVDFENDMSTRSYAPTESGVEKPVYQGTQRSISSSGDTEHTLVNPNPSGFATPDPINQPAGSNGVRYLNVDASSGDALKIERQANLVGLDYFTFLVRPKADQQFTLTVRLEEEKNGSTVTHEAGLPVPNVDGWVKYTISYSDLAEYFGISDFDPVDQRSGGSGPLKSISFVTDANVEYGLDQILFGVEGEGARVEIHDFEEPNLAWGPPFVGGNDYSFSQTVADASDGYTSHSVSGSDTFGFNYGDDFSGVALMYLDVDGNDVLSFRARAKSGTAGFEAGLTSFEGGFNGTKTVSLDENWQRYEVRIDELGSDPAALNGELVQVVFTPNGDVLFDDVKIMPKQ